MLSKKCLIETQYLYRCNSQYKFNRNILHSVIEFRTLNSRICYSNNAFSSGLFQQIFIPYLLSPNNLPCIFYQFEDENIKRKCISFFLKYGKNIQSKLKPAVDGVTTINSQLMFSPQSAYYMRLKSKKKKLSIQSNNQNT